MLPAPVSIPRAGRDITAGCLRGANTVRHKEQERCDKDKTPHDKPVRVDKADHSGLATRFHRRHVAVQCSPPKAGIFPIPL
jgi:hypothetical protein